MRPSAKSKAGPEEPEKDVANPYLGVSNVYDKFGNPYLHVSNVYSVTPDEPEYNFEYAEPSVRIFSVHRSSEKYE